MTKEQRRIVLGVTSDLSLVLMKGFPSYLASQGWEVHVTCAPGPNLDALSRQGDVVCHALPMAREPSGFADLRALWRWIRLLRKVRPDVLMVGTPKAALLGLVAGRLTRVPTRIYQLRGLRLETTHGVARRIWGFLERVAFRSATSTLAVSASLRRQAISLDLVPAEDIIVLGGGSSNGIDLDRFRPANPSHPTPALAGLDHRIPVVGFVGRLNKDKGVGVLFRASSLLTLRGVEHQILIVGGVDGSNDADKTLASRPPIVIPHVSDTSPYYRHMQVLCLPTLREGFPNVVLEASASGIPVVTTNATGAIDSVVDGLTGLIAEMGSAQSLADKLEQVLGDAGAAAEMGRQGRTFVEESYAREVVWARLADYLNDSYLQASARNGRGHRVGAL